VKGFSSSPAKLLGILLLTVAALFLNGCATHDPDNASARPWNSPKSWESGLPSGAFEGR